LFDVGTAELMPIKSGMHISPLVATPTSTLISLQWAIKTQMNGTSISLM